MHWWRRSLDAMSLVRFLRLRGPRLQGMGRLHSRWEVRGVRDDRCMYKELFKGVSIS